MKLRLEALCFFLISCGLAAMSGSSFSAEPVRIATIGHGYWAGPLYVAQRADLFAKNGLEPTFTTVKGGSLALQALLSKNVDVSLLSYEHIAQAASKGQRVVAVYRLVNRNIVNIVASNEIAKSGKSLSVGDRIKKLEGKRIGVSSAGASSDKMLTVLGEKYGLKMNNVQKVFLGGSPGAYLAAFQKGLIDAAMVVEPAGSMVKQAGYGDILVDIMKGEEPAYDDLIFMVVGAHPDTLKERPELVRKVAKVFQDAMDLIKKNPEYAQRLLAQEYPDMDPALNARVYEATNAVWTTNGEMTEAAGRRVLDYLLKQGTSVDKVDVQETFTNAFLPKN